ncbi:hypothetical protein C0J52_07185 [Blattella germanica]|nr:hypothetical protein C0J52_07185 [Blattella germanica]
MSVRQTCSIESAAKMNPEAKVYLLHSCPFDLETQITARQLLYYPNVKFWTMSLENLMADVNPHSCDMTVHTSQTFFPVAYWEWKMLFNDSDEKDVEERIKNSFGVHIWNKLSFEEKVYPGSKQPYSTLADEFCPLAYSTAGEFF